jgi:hypothetical protein
MKRTTEDYLGETVTEAVITVPATLRPFVNTKNEKVLGGY